MSGSAVPPLELQHGSSYGATNRSLGPSFVCGCVAYIDASSMMHSTLTALGHKGCTKVTLQTIHKISDTSVQGASSENSTQQPASTTPVTHGAQHKQAHHTSAGAIPTCHSGVHNKPICVCVPTVNSSLHICKGNRGSSNEGVSVFI